MYSNTYIGDMISIKPEYDFGIQILLVIRYYRIIFESAGFFLKPDAEYNSIDCIDIMCWKRPMR